METRTSTVKIPSIFPKVLNFRGNASRFFIICFLAVFVYYGAVYYPHIFHPVVQSFLFQSAMFLSSGFILLSWIGSRTNSVTFTPDYLIIQAERTIRIDARTPYGFALREYWYRRKGLRQLRSYIDESFVIYLVTVGSGDIELGCVYGRNRAESILNALRAEKAKLNKNRAYSIEDTFDESPYGDRPQFKKEDWLN